MFREPEAISAEDAEYYSALGRRRARHTYLEQWAEHRAAMERELSWFDSHRQPRDVRHQLRTLRYMLDLLDKKIQRSGMADADPS